MANVYDQFDTPSQAPAANPYDQFDNVLTDDGLPQGHPDVIEGPGARLTKMLAHPIQAIENAWAYPGSYLGNAISGAASSVKNAVNLPGDVATGKVDLNDPSQAVENAGRVFNMAGLTTPISPGSVGSKLAADAAPSMADLFAKGGAGFDAWRANGPSIPADAVAQWAMQNKQSLLNRGIRDLPAGAPSAHATLDEIIASAPGALDASPAELDAIRKTFVNNVAGAGANNTERGANATLRNSLMDFLVNSSPEGSGLKDAVGNWAAAERSDFLNNIESNAELQGMRAHSGHPGGNPIRQNVASALRVNPATGQNMAMREGLNPDEIDALRNVVGGGPNSVRTASNMLGGGLGHAGMIGAILAAKEGYEHGGVMGGLAGAGLPFVGTALRKLDESLTAKRLAEADNLVRMRSPLAQQMGPARGEAVFPTVDNKLVRALLTSQGQPADQ